MAKELTKKITILIHPTTFKKFVIKAVGTGETYQTVLRKLILKYSEDK